VETLRTNISINQQNLCLISGFMCSLAGAVYTSQPDEGLCFGDAGKYGRGETETNRQKTKQTANSN
jgi:hypothetical protein